MKVHCANCLRIVEDGGERYTCPVCGTSPVPSYSYPEDSCFHPSNCNCEVNTHKPTVVRKRRYPLPTKPKLK